MISFFKSVSNLAFMPNSVYFPGMEGTLSYYNEHTLNVFVLLQCYLAQLNTKQITITCFRCHLETYPFRLSLPSSLVCNLVMGLVLTIGFSFYASTTMFPANWSFTIVLIRQRSKLSCTKLRQI